MEICVIDSPVKIEKLPLDKIYVLDNWLPSSLHHFYDTQISRANFWSKGNEVRGDSPTGLPHHQFWGGAILSGYDEDKRPLSVDDIEDKYTYFPRYLNRKL